MEQLEAGVVETVTGVARFFDAQLSWYGRRPTQLAPVIASTTRVGD